jgi:hypothetical protein
MYQDVIGQCPIWDRATGLTDYSASTRWRSSSGNASVAWYGPRKLIPLNSFPQLLRIICDDKRQLLMMFRLNIEAIQKPQKKMRDFRNNFNGLWMSALNFFAQNKKARRLIPGSLPSVTWLPDKSFVAITPCWTVVPHIQRIWPGAVVNCDRKYWFLCPSVAGSSRREIFQSHPSMVADHRLPFSGSLSRWFAYLSIWKKPFFILI